MGDVGALDPDSRLLENTSSSNMSSSSVVGISEAKSLSASSESDMDRKGSSRSDR